MDKIKVCIDHLNEIFDNEDLATQIDFGTLHAVVNRHAPLIECDLVEDGIHLSGPLTTDHIYHLYEI